MDPTDPKLIQALINNHVGKHIQDNFALVFGLRWEPAPEGFLCPHCNGAMERTVGLMLMSPWVGSVRCTDCKYRNSVCGYLGQSMIRVEPMPPGAALTYHNDPNVVDAILSDEPPVTEE
jgi:hypothetical protein